MSRIWIDVEDLFAYAMVFRRPSGIQRTVFEFCRAFAEHPEVGYLRHAGHDGFSQTSWRDIEALFAQLATGTAAAGVAPSTAWQLQTAALRSVRQALAGLLPAVSRAATPAPFSSGDVLLVAGAGWDDPTHTRRLLATRRRFGLKLAVLIYDLIPLRRPEWADPSTARRFGHWIDALLREADVLLAISAATAGDVASRRATLGLASLPCQLVRLGDGFSAAEGAAATLRVPYALFVSTLEIRKNHALLVEAWRVLLARFDPQVVPRLVFAGRQGPLAGDLLTMLKASDWLGGHIILKQEAGDAELAALYRGSSFTLFPSHYEGWGLPVAESLCFGKPCLATSATSVPEVGGALVRYFDPLDLAGTIAAIAAVIAAPADLAAWEERIRREFRPTSWRSTAAAVVAAVMPNRR